MPYVQFWLADPDRFPEEPIWHPGDPPKNVAFELGALLPSDSDPVFAIDDGGALWKAVRERARRDGTSAADVLARALESHLGLPEVDFVPKKVDG